MSTTKTQALPEVVNELFRPFGIEKADGDYKRKIDQKEAYIEAFDNLAGTGTDDLEQSHEVGGTVIKLERSKPYTDDCVDLGWGAGLTGTEVFDVGRSVVVKGLVSVTSMNIQIKSFVAVSLRSSTLDDAKPKTNYSVKYGFTLPTEIAESLFGQPDKKFTEKEAAGQVNVQAFELTIKALQNLESYKLQAAGVMV